MKYRQKEKETPKTFKWYLDKILMVGIAVLVITAYVIWTVATEKDNMTLLYIAAAMIPGTGLLITPNIILSAIKDSRDWRGRLFRDRRGKYFQGQLLREDFFYGIKLPSSYHSKVLFGVIREAVLNSGVWIILIAYIIIRSIILPIFGMNRYPDRAFLFLLIILALLILIVSYNITCSIYRIRTVLRQEYSVYHAIVSKADWSDIYITGTKGKVYQFEHCRCLGIRAKKIKDTKAILVFVPDEVYLLPYYDGS